MKHPSSRRPQLRSGENPISPKLTVTATLLALFTLAFFAILYANSGHFAYTLDAPYTHLALAEQIRHGTYGLNRGEPAAPSSTILYPLLLVPLWPLGQYGPALLCVLATIGSGLAVCSLAASCNVQLERMRPLYLAAITACLAVGLNIIGVAMTGLEHSLHAMLTILSLLGLVRFLQNGRSDWWWLLTIALLPLVRFESMSAVLTDAFVLFVFGKRLYAIGVLAAGFAMVFAFALFLHSQGLPYLPTSVTARSQVVSSGLGMQSHHGLASLIRNIASVLKGNVLSFGATQLLLLMVLAGWSLAPVIASRSAGRHAPTSAPQPTRIRMLTPAAAGFFILIGAAQLLAGSLQSAGRYEVYLFSLGACSLLVCYRIRVAAFVETMRLGGCVAVCVTVLTIFAGYGIRTLQNIPASQTVYQGSFQLRHYLADFYARDFAINRPGLVKFGNPHAMLDLSGLASVVVQQALREHRGADTLWMDRLVRQRGIGLVVLYADTPTPPPTDWIPLAELNSTNRSVGVGGSLATFYAVTEADIPAITGSLHKFAPHLPREESLRMLDHASAEHAGLPAR